MFGILPNRSDFVKQCPSCAQPVALRDLRKIPRNAKPRWYQVTSAPHTACPHCGQHVIFTLANSPLIVVPFVLVALVAGVPMLFPWLNEAFTAMPWLKMAAEFAVFVASSIVLTYGVRRAGLVEESSR